jgi:hypothetical protein
MSWIAYIYRLPTRLWPPAYLSVARELHNEWQFPVLWGLSKSSEGNRKQAIIFVIAILDKRHALECLTPRAGFEERGRSVAFSTFILTGVHLRAPCRAFDATYRASQMHKPQRAAIRMLRIAFYSVGAFAIIDPLQNI